MCPFQFLAIVLLGATLLVPASGQAAVNLNYADRPQKTAQSPSDMDLRGRAVTTTTTLMPSIDVAMRWAADDAAIVNGDASHTWTWGPHIFRSTQERYAESPNHARTVWYLDKARMEITHPDLDADNTWFVTSGLLVRELISGELQTGDSMYESREPANVPLAGDLNAAIEQTITFLDLQSLSSLDNDKRAPNRTEYDTVVVEVLRKGGVVAQDEQLLQYDVRLRSYDPVLGHNIAHVFTEALPSDKLLYIAGRPLTEPYWITVPVNHQPTLVLVQAFERRVLTYTPSNPSGWQVEWGNVGRQYAQWRYGSPEDGSPVDPALALDVKPDIRALEALAPEAARIAKEHEGDVAVAVVDMRTGDMYSVEGTHGFPMYSTAKVPIMLAVLNKVQREKRAIAQWEDNLIRGMIHVSDNEAATSLIIHAGGASQVNRYLQAIGLQNTIMDGESWGYSTTTAQDMARLIAKLGNCAVLNAELCQYALDVMRGVTPSQRWGITGGVPDPLSVALKNGWFPEGEGWTVNSMGYIKGKGLRYAIAVYTRPNSSMREGIDTIEAISSHVYTGLN